ncbi:MAG: HAD-IA family hydrolase [Pirellulales bacterium]|nr:HAD-IA family hydrolase [Pirellulales bacterium]
MRAVVFDMDGLMFNTEDIYTMTGGELLRRRGCEFTGSLKDEMMGLPPRESFEIMIRRHRLSETWQELAVESNRIFLSILDGQLATMPGLLSLLDALRRADLPLAVATSSARELLDACLSRFSLQDRFAFFLTAEDVTQGKPHPEIYLTAAARFGIPPREMAVLEDSQNGCRAAVAAGAFAIAVPADHSRNHDFRGANLIVDTLADPRLYAALGLSGEGGGREA